MNRLTLGLTAALFTIVACSQDTVPSNNLNGTPSSTSTSSPASYTASQSNGINRSYNLTASDSGQMSFMATFRVKGSWTKTVKLVAPSQLVVNGQNISDMELMSKESATLSGMFLPILSPFFWLASGTHYYKNLGFTSGPVSVEWTDPNGQVIRDQLSVPSGGSVNPPSFASTSAAMAVQISGPAGDFEASIDQDGIDGTRKHIFANSRGGSSVEFSASDMATLHSGPATLTVERNSTVTLTGGGSGSTTYKFSPLSINIY